jgi:hypothetical protein
MSQFEKELKKVESITEKIARRDEQANIIKEIVRLAKKLDYVHYQLADRIRHPNYIDEHDMETFRKDLDKNFWHEILDEYQAEKYMTATDKKNFFEKLDENSPIFDLENVQTMVDSFVNSKEALATNMIAKIYENVTDSYFRVGGKNRGEKRIQKEIPASFRLSVFYTYGKGLPSYVSTSNSRFNIISDLERACYLCDGKKQPDYNNTIESRTTLVFREGKDYLEGEYFNLKFYKNGNVLISFNNLDVLNTLNKWGRKNNRID